MCNPHKLWWRIFCALALTLFAYLSGENAYAKDTQTTDGFAISLQECSVNTERDTECRFALSFQKDMSNIQVSLLDTKIFDSALVRYDVLKANIRTFNTLSDVFAEIPAHKIGEKSAFSLFFTLPPESRPKLLKVKLYWSYGSGLDVLKAMLAFMAGVPIDRADLEFDVP